MYMAAALAYASSSALDISYQVLPGIMASVCLGAFTWYYGKCMSSAYAVMYSLGWAKHHSLLEGSLSLEAKYNILKEQASYSQRFPCMVIYYTWSYVLCFAEVK